MTRSRTYELVDDRLGGSLETSLRLWRECQVSVPAMTRILAASTGVDMSPETVRRWLRRLDDQAAA